MNLPPTGGKPAASLMSAGTDHEIRHGDHPLPFFMDIDELIVAAVSLIVHRAMFRAGMNPDAISLYHTCIPGEGGRRMKYGARNQVTAKVTSIQRGDVMSLIKFEVDVPASMASVITTESLDDLTLKIGDSVRLVIKAIHVLPVKD
jgi:molybdate transport system regulatory protein